MARSLHCKVKRVVRISGADGKGSLPDALGRKFAQDLGLVSCWGGVAEQIFSQIFRFHPLIFSGGFCPPDCFLQPFTLGSFKAAPKKVQANPPQGSIEPLKRFYPTPNGSIKPPFFRTTDKILSSLSPLEPPLCSLPLQMPRPATEPRNPETPKVHSKVRKMPFSTPREKWARKPIKMSKKSLFRPIPPKGTFWTF